jgi:NTE family protein
VAVQVAGRQRDEKVERRLHAASWGRFVSQIHNQIHKMGLGVAEPAPGLRIGVALSGGGAAGLAHVGVLEELGAAGIPIYCVAGASAGAMVGAAWAADRLAAFRDTMCRLTRRRVLWLFDPTWPRSGLLEGRRSLELIRPHVGERIEGLPHPFAAVATDLRSGAEVVLRDGDVLEAIRGSIAIPGLFTPQHGRGRLLVDGGLTNPLPVDVAFQLGAQFVIAVSVVALPDDSIPRKGEPQRLTAQLLARIWDGERAARHPEEAKPPPQDEDDVSDDIGLIEVLSKAMTVVQVRIAAARLREQPPDCLVVVPPTGIGLFDFHRAAEAVDAGRLAAREALPTIRMALLSAEPLHQKLARWVDAAAGRIAG